MADILIFSAHPDDAEFAMGGTLITLARKHTLAHIICTRGEAGTHGTPELREKEAKTVGKTYGFSVEFLDYHDTHIEDTIENTHRIAQKIREYTPQIILAPYHTNPMWHLDGMAHPDHTALGNLVRKAARLAKFTNATIDGNAHEVHKVIYYMVPHYTRPSMIIDVTDVMDELEHMWQLHTTQMALHSGKVREALKLMRQMTGRPMRIPYAEGFLIDEPVRLNPQDLFRI